MLDLARTKIAGGEDDRASKYQSNAYDKWSKKSNMNHLEDEVSIVVANQSKMMKEQKQNLPLKNCMFNCN